MVETALFVSVEHLWPVVEAGVLANLFVSDGHEVVSLSYNIVHQARGTVSNSAVDEIAEISGVLEISIVDELHLHNHIQEKLKFIIQFKTLGHRVPLYLIKGMPQ